MQTPQTPVLTPQLMNRLQSELRDGERLVWAAQPLPGLMERKGILLALFGIPFTLIALVWVGGAFFISRLSGFGPCLMFPVFGCPFIAVGFGLLTSPMWIRRAALRTVYAITDQRAIVLQGKMFGDGVNAQSFAPDRLTSMSRNERADGCGDLIFEQFSQRVGNNTSTVRRGFLAIENVHGVEELILNTLLSGRARTI